MPKCRHCGSCCYNMALDISPKKMKVYFYNWYNKKKDGVKPDKIWLIYPMLIPLGYDRKIKRWRYKCKHLIKRNNKFICSIYELRPLDPCKSYGEGAGNLFVSGNYKPYNKKFYPNCVF